MTCAITHCVLFPDVQVPIISTAEAKRSARRVLFASAPDAARLLYHALNDRDIESTQIRAALAILDRTGFGAQSTIMVDDVTVDYDTLTDDQLRARAQKVVAMLHARRSTEQTANSTSTDDRTNDDDTTQSTKPPQVH